MYVGDFFRYIREYLSNVRDSVTQRNYVSNEYARNKLALNEKKNKRLLLDCRLWEIDLEGHKGLELSIETVKQNAELARKFILPEVS